MLLSLELGGFEPEVLGALATKTRPLNAQARIQIRLKKPGLFFFG